MSSETSQELRSAPRRIAIVVPTRNRPDIAELSIRSVLAEHLEDVQVVVSDNSDVPGASEQLERQCDALPDTVRYIRPDATLPMTEHWQWALERALTDPNVSHVAFLTDRMVFLRGELSRILRAVELTPGRIVSYSHDHLDDLEHPIRCTPTRFSGRLLSIPSRALLGAVARGEHPMAVPRMLNTVVPRAVLEAVQTRFGSVFASVSPDFAFAFRALVVVDEIAFLDRPVLLAHSAGRSNGTSVARGIKSPDGEDFEALTGASMFPDAPVPDLATISNAVYNEYGFVAREAPGCLPAVQRRHYLQRIAADVAVMESPELVERTMRRLTSLGWGPREERQARRRHLATGVRFWGRRPAALIQRKLRGVRGPEEPQTITADTVEQAIELMQSSPRIPSSDPIQLIQFVGTSGGVKVLDRP